jgi:hypothetical protein
MGFSDGGKVPPQSLRARLADVQRSTDGAYRGNTVTCQVSREHRCGTLAERIDREAIVMRARLTASICALRMIIIKSS